MQVNVLAGVDPIVPHTANFTRIGRSHNRLQIQSLLKGLQQWRSLRLQWLESVKGNW
jgi:hypothetical protein